jgi:PAS domain S-box-containing protein
MTLEVLQAENTLLRQRVEELEQKLNQLEPSHSLNRTHVNPIEEEVEQRVDERTSMLQHATAQLLRELTQRDRTEKELRTSQDELEQLIQQHTIELSDINAALQSEIVERRQAEETLRKSEEQFRAFFEQAPIGIGVSRNGITLMVNPAYLRIFGYERSDELVDHPITMCIAPSDRSIAIERARNRFEGKSAESQFALTGLRKDGTFFPTLCDVSRVILMDGEPASVAFFTDISHLKEAEAALQRAHDELERRVAERTAKLLETNRALQTEIIQHRHTEAVLREREKMLQTVLDASPDLISNTTVTGDVVWVSSSVTDILGIKQDDYLSIPWTNRVHPDDLQHTMEIFESILQNPERVEQRRFRVRHKHGHWVFLESRARVITDEHGHPQNIIAFSRDVTAQATLEASLKQARAEAEAAMRYKDHFLATMSHELRTPLNAILGLTEALQEQVYGSLNEKQMTTLATVERSGYNLLSLINDILDLSRIEAGKIELQIAPVMVESLCQSSLHLIRQQAQNKHIDVSLTTDQAPATIQADELRLKQILVNLLTNAVKFTPAHGRAGLEVVAKPQQHIIQFVVWDTGIGIDSGDIEQLFKPFVQLDSSLARHYEGTGLGLSLVARLTELHGGTVEVESKVGQGSSFTISLPWKDRAVAKPEDTSTPTELSSSSPVMAASDTHILLAEDNEATIQVLTDYLEAKGYQVCVVRTGNEVLEHVQQHQPHLILMDIQMPHMNGLDAIRALRANVATARTPIIAMTALALPGDRERCLEAGADEYMSKPVHLKNLVHLIEQYR